MTGDVIYVKLRSAAGEGSYAYLEKTARDHDLRVLIVAALGLAAAAGWSLARRFTTGGPASTSAASGPPVVAVPPSAAPESDRPARLSEARAVLERHCGLCHREDSPQARRGALAVFNLNAADWSASMSEERLRSARDRLETAPGGGDPADPEDVARFDAFVALELRQRARSSPN